MRERLIELLDDCGRCDKHTKEKGCVGCEYEYFEDKCVNHLRERMADDLLANGVIVPPVSVGQTVYVVNRYYGGVWRIHECRVDNLTIYEKHIFMSLIDGKYNFGIEKSEIGKTVFLSREEAEKALKEREG